MCDVVGHVSCGGLWGSTRERNRVVKVGADGGQVRSGPLLVSRDVSEEYP